MDAQRYLASTIAISSINYTWRGVTLRKRRISASVTNRMCNEANSRRCCACVSLMETRSASARTRGQVISCFRGQLWQTRRKRRRKSLDPTVRMRDSDLLSFPTCLAEVLHSPRLAQCACTLATMRCRTRSTNERHAFGKEKENDGAVRCSSCGTNLIPLSP